MSVTDPDFCLNQASDYLHQGKIVAFPTDTVYGLAVALNSLNAEEHIYSLKHRDKGKSLVIYVNTLEDIEKLSGYPLSSQAIKLAQEFLPGPLTLLVDHRNSRFPQEKLGFRILALPIINRLIDLSGPLLGTSANISNFPPAIISDEVIDDFPNEDIFIIPGQCFYGLESTVVSTDPLKIYREGVISRDTIEKVMGKSIESCLAHHTFSQHVTIYTVRDDKALKEFLQLHSNFQGLICEDPQSCNFYPTLRKALRSSKPEVVFVYNQHTSLYPELISYLAPYTYTHPR
ncbi:t(6)A37 threonylcarbamoyladenosine biosynthesis protein RimN,tRNA(ANN) t(6)A37 threonylcarbamoyladenosine modification protein,Putative translation factor (SUA5),Sua5/YciO/YrdC/YwlC family protein,yrdC domain [Chlamydia poikilotherma]|uniref:L-threonylcarbamoyladenylate synthase n=1 Tax=Chlamydia poikilotherma TaxID=1967783 RepID=A0A3B0QGH1_9CHLA|nr:L-threonylcarbamoyladenylate synthase [Chlamydia poikilotherma]SYX08994.1 t(6)A37 threonylcarbamoyladenosine biosynthesis protein RimN,tRNA(ANN) t(6)A37 threonylcarbamoyladenosine modification protein,Putative translation factor (SUA5),Sua5/YciO/YrdC/YwlC family protein,yrdC domain [Chlamydia poikilotherma]